jgi:hypothetical protein
MRFVIALAIAALLAGLPLLAQRAVAPKPAPAPAATAPTPAAPSDPGSQAFLAAVKEYWALRSKVDDSVPQLTETSDPTKIAARERALGDALIKARANAKEGDVFVKPFIPVLQRIIKADFAKRTAAERKALSVELPKGIVVKINSTYPTTIPLATFPPNLLVRLPELPDQLEYRIIHRHLILRDVRANYVIDMVPNVFPIPM